jgi:hypothetical protein
MKYLKLVTKATARYEKLKKDFDFERVHKTMLALDWRWQGSPTSPTVDEMKNWLDKLFLSMLKEYKHGIVGMKSGGFTLSVDKKAHVIISFIVEEACSGE